MVLEMGLNSWWDNNANVVTSLEDLPIAPVRTRSVIKQDSRLIEDWPEKSSLAERVSHTEFE